MPLNTTVTVSTPATSQPIEMVLLLVMFVISQEKKGLGGGTEPFLGH
jgi:hypothetical protein